MFQKNCRGKKVLIVEADFVDREALSMILAAEGYMVPAAASQIEALEILRSPERPDLIVLDLSSSRQDSLAFHQAIQEDPLLSSIPMIILTPKEQAQVSTPGVKCLDKPVDTHRLLEAINSHFLVPSLG